MRLTSPFTLRFRTIAAALTLAAFLGFVCPVGVSMAAETKSKTHQTGAKKTTAKKSTAKKSSAKKKTTAKKPAGKAAQKKSSGPRYAAIVMDADTGAILSQSGADAQVYPASLTKMMTLLLVYERLETGTVTLNQRVLISNHAANQAPSKLGLPAGSSIEMKNAIYAIVTKSANDIAMAVAENVGGSEGHFVYMMNEKARQIGMTGTTFKNPTGLHNAGQVTTARDFAKLSRHLIKAYPREYRYFATKNFYYNGIANRNHNRLMETYAGMDGIKTGFINPSGFNLAASAKRGNHRLIAVVFGGKTAQTRNTQVASLLDEGFAKVTAAPAQPGTQPIAQVPVAAIPANDPRLTPTAGTAVVRTAASTYTPVTAQPERVVPPPAMAGQGDFDPAVQRRYETGMMAITAIKDAAQATKTAVVPAAATTAAATVAPPAAEILGNEDWAIQLGSYSSRVKGDEALRIAVSRLPAAMQGAARPVIVPLQAGNSWVYRARLRGFTRDQASAACQYFSNCMAISPRAF